MNETRRDFLKRAAITAVAMPFLLNCKSDTLAQKAENDILSLIKKNAIPTGGEWSGAIDAPGNVSWKTVLSKKSDRDEPMIISGTVFEADGKRVAPNILIYFYHTDSEGYYGRNGEHRHGHFRSWMLTDARGRYEFSSIRPVSYPNTTNPMHVHMTLTGENFKEDWIDSIWFEGDKFITPEARKRLSGKGGFNPIVKLEKGADGILRGARDIQLLT